jgi:hypothetical protein
MNTRTVQNIFDDQRENTNKIEELEDEIKNLKNQLKELKSRSKELKKEEKEMCIDLIKQKKIKWVECDLNSWREYVEKNKYDDPAIYYIYYNDGSIYQQGYFIGVHKLIPKDYLHFEQYLNDYFYYGTPNYEDHNDTNHDGSECYLAFGSGSAYIKSFTWD